MSNYIVIGENPRGVRTWALEITLGADSDLTQHGLRKNGRDGVNDTGGGPCPCRWIHVVVGPAEMELFSEMMETKLDLKGISFLGYWTEQRPVTVQMFLPLMPCYQFLFLLYLLSVSGA